MTTLASDTKRARTRQRLIDRGLDLIERQGYDATSVAQIAAAAGVTQMTFFRYFATKEQLVLEDYDPYLASGIGEQPRELPPLQRAARIHSAWRAAARARAARDPPSGARIAARTPSCAARCGAAPATPRPRSSRN